MKINSRINIIKNLPLYQTNKMNLIILMTAEIIR